MNNTNPYYPVGKLPQDDLIKLLAQTTDTHDPRIILGPGLGRDAAVLDFGNRYLVAKTDPITFATNEIGWYAVNVNANDIACLGAQPQWFIASLLLPEGKTDRALVERIFQEIHSAGQELGVLIVGGHTEITHGLDRPIVVGAMFGEVCPDKLIRSDGARPGDALILTKGIAVEGTALLAHEAGERLHGLFPAADLEQAAHFLHKPGISVVRDATIATTAGEVHAMHDPTEGGIATGIHELTAAAEVGAILDADALPIYPITRALCDALGLNPLGLIASGSLLAAVKMEDAAPITRALNTAGIAATVIGYIREEPGVVLHTQTGIYPLPAFSRDEIARLFETK
ncbi:MAG: AIR synthase family protein [Anaerolineae bacterium]|nr:AIR synthase family protein [Anaerolineae bacterium]